MRLECTVNGCRKPRAGYARLCSTHRSRKRRHGHEEQQTIGKKILGPLVERVQARIAKQPDAKLWSICEQRWENATSQWRSNPPDTMHRPTRHGARELVRLADTVSGRDAAVTTIAMYMLQADNPRLFKSEDGFRTQLVRRVRSLSDASYSQSEGANDGRSRRAMKELEPKTVAVIGQLLVTLFGPAGLKVAKLERLEEEKERLSQLAYLNSVREIE